jgi:hypothetical protein
MFKLFNSKILLSTFIVGLALHMQSAQCMMQLKSKVEAASAAPKKLLEDRESKIRLQYLTTSQYDSIVSRVTRRRDVDNDETNNAICASVKIRPNRHHIKLINSIRKHIKPQRNFLIKDDQERELAYETIEDIHNERYKKIRAAMRAIEKEELYSHGTKIEDIPLHDAGTLKQDSTKQKVLKLAGQMGIGAVAGAVAGRVAGNIYQAKFGADATVASNAMQNGAWEGLWSGHRQTTGSQAIGTVISGAAGTAYAKQPAKVVSNSGSMGGYFTDPTNLAYFVVGGTAGIVFNKQKSFEIFTKWGGWAPWVIPAAGMILGYLLNVKSKEIVDESKSAAQQGIDFLFEHRYPFNKWPLNKIEGKLDRAMTEFSFDERYEFYDRVRSRNKRVRRYLSWDEANEIAQEVANLDIPDNKDIVKVKQQDEVLLTNINKSAKTYVEVTYDIYQGRWWKSFKIRCGHYRDIIKLRVVSDDDCDIDHDDKVFMEHKKSKAPVCGRQHYINFFELFLEKANFSSREIAQRVQKFEEIAPILSNAGEENEDDTSDDDDSE